MSGGGNTITAVGSGGCSGGGGGGGNNSNNNNNNNSNGPCGACKFLRRKCVAGCIFAPYFDSEQGSAYFAAVHKVFGASNVSKLLLHLPVNRRSDAVVTICYEAQARLRDPIYGCVAHIFALQQQVVNLQAEVSYLQAHLASLELPQPRPPPPLPQSQPQPLFATPPPPLTITDLPVSVSSTYDLASIFDQTTPFSPSWSTQRRVVDPRHQYGVASSSSSVAVDLGGGNNDLQALAHELLHRQGSPPPPTTDDSPSRSMSR